MTKDQHSILKILLIIPCYNEEFRLNAKSFVDYAKCNSNIYFLFVDDGSKDQTTIILKELCHKIKNADKLVLDTNKGKGEAIRSGVLVYKNKLKEYNYIGYLDADLSVPLAEINNFVIDIQKNQNIKFLLGARISRLGAQINRSTSRHYMGRVFATVVSLILKEPVYDSQCGAKLIESSMVLELFKDKFISKWLFDIELLIRWKTIFPNDIDKVYEKPLTNWKEIPGTKLKFKDLLYTPIGLFTIWRKYHKLLK